MHVIMTDGSEMDIGPGDAFYIPPGHDAWIVGNDACVALDFTGAAAYAKK
jgi:mannose-6-phosphate isomerase-like protein (cupin superfamily)